MAEYKLLMVMSANSTPDQKKNAGQVADLQEAVIYKTNLHTNFTQ